MRLGVLGCGMMGSAAAYALATDPRVRELVLVDQDLERSEALAAWLRPFGPAPAIRTAAVDLDRTAAGCAALEGLDSVAAALPWEATRPAIAAALATGCPLASVTRPSYADLPALEEAIQAAGGRVLLPCGLEPGLAEILARAAVERLERVAELRIRCGGIPVEPRPPLGYTALFGGGTRLPIGMRDAYAVDHGSLRAVPRFSDPEPVAVRGIGCLEAFHDGMVPWIAGDQVFGKVPSITQKTLRWPGFAATMARLAELGLLSETPLLVDGGAVVPRRVVEAALQPMVARRRGEEDVTILQAEASGERRGEVASLRLELRASFDRRTRLTAMAQTTGYTLAWATRSLALDEIAATGWLKPHLVIHGRLRDDLLRDLGQRGIEVSIEELPREEPGPMPTPAGRGEGSPSGTA